MNAHRISRVARRALCMGSAAILLATSGGAFAAEPADDPSKEESDQQIRQFLPGQSKKKSRKERGAEGSQSSSNDTYTLQLHDLRCKESMTDKGGEKDAVTIILRLAEHGNPDVQPVTTLAVVCREGSVIPLEDADTRKPIVLYKGPLRSDLELTANIYVALPKGFSNVRDALRKYAAATGTTLQTVGAATAEPGLCAGRHGIETGRGQGRHRRCPDRSLERSRGETVCKDRVKWVKGYNKTKKREKLLAHANQGSFKLKTFKKKQWCFGVESGKIKYVLTARLVRESAG
ncbi:MAG: hypothetical protein KatS3mg082_2035 [Nitrospiraceae bacterium]|nr:MAG: hypothetical protein KatS3mg082_2035 [Nitrospiraceae bacterium]